MRFSHQFHQLLIEQFMRIHTKIFQLETSIGTNNCHCFNLLRFVFQIAYIFQFDTRSIYYIFISFQHHLLAFAMPLFLVNSSFFLLLFIFHLFFCLVFAFPLCLLSSCFLSNFAQANLSFAHTSPTSNSMGPAKITDDCSVSCDFVFSFNFN